MGADLKALAEAAFRITPAGSDRKPDYHVDATVSEAVDDETCKVLLDGAGDVPLTCRMLCTASPGDRVAVRIKASGPADVTGRVGGLVSPSELDELEELLGISPGGGAR